MTNFESPEVWNQVIRLLARPTEIRNWTADKGYLGDSLEARWEGGDYLTCLTPRARGPIRVPKADVELIGRQWERYAAGLIGRASLRDESRVTKYVISILKEISLQAMA